MVQLLEALDGSSGISGLNSRLPACSLAPAAVGIRSVSQCVRPPCPISVTRSSLLTIIKGQVLGPHGPW